VASQLSAFTESQLRVISSPSLIFEADTDRVATGASCDGSNTGSEFAPSATPAPASPKFSSVLQESKKTEKINATRLFEKTDANNEEDVIDALQLYRQYTN
jgi:hypothetical protein